MKLQQLIQSLRKGIYAWAFWIPFTFMFFEIGGLFKQSDNFLFATIMWFVPGSIIGIFSGLATVTVVWAASKLAKLSRIKSTVFATSTVLCLGGFVGGAIFHLLPDTTCYKLMMPGTYGIILKKASYSIWYYPDWNRPDQKEFLYTINKRREDEPNPHLIISDTTGGTIKLKPLSVIYHQGRMLRKQIYEFKINKAGTYKIRSFRPGKNKGFVIAIVPFAAYDPYRDGKPPHPILFPGDDDPSDLISNQWKRYPQPSHLPKQTVD